MRRHTVVDLRRRAIAERLLQAPDVASAEVLSQPLTRLNTVAIAVLVDLLVPRGPPNQCPNQITDGKNEAVQRLAEVFGDGAAANAMSRSIFHDLHAKIREDGSRILYLTVLLYLSVAW